ncbi:MAG: hypothetical protein M3Z21_08400 [Pseudomonadota bacterium]|nr:hypothetical protein [Pseudomonadota bacterium]
MRRIPSLLFLGFVVLGLCLAGQQIAFAQVPVLERYHIRHGGDQGGGPEFAALLADGSFGNGTAKATVVLSFYEDAGSLSLRVWRRVRSGEITFALLVSRGIVRGYDGDGNLVYSHDLEGFVFGDSQSGKWSQRLSDLPASIRRINITFLGNYE